MQAARPSYFAIACARSRSAALMPTTRSAILPSSLARQRLDVQLQLPRLRQELRILHGRVERLAKHLQLVRSNTRRRHHRATDRSAGRKKAHHGLVLVGLAELHDRGHVRKIGVTFGNGLNENVDLLVRQPMVPARTNGAQRAVGALDLATFHGDVDLRRRLVAAHELEPRAQSMNSEGVRRSRSAGRRRRRRSRALRDPQSVAPERGATCT